VRTWWRQGKGLWGAGGQALELETLGPGAGLDMPPGGRARSPAPPAPPLQVAKLQRQNASLEEQLEELQEQVELGVAPGAAAKAAPAPAAAAAAPAVAAAPGQELQGLRAQLAALQQQHEDACAQVGGQQAPLAPARSGASSSLGSTVPPAAEPAATFHARSSRSWPTSSTTSSTR
jgi:hypothetical protein